MLKFFILIFSLFSLSDLSAQNTNISGIINVYRKVTGTDSAKGLVKLSNASNLTQYIGNNVMIIQMKGAVINSVTSPSFGDITDIAGAGQFEIAKICGQISDTIVFENKLQNFYDPAGLVQMVVIPHYVNVTVTDTLRPQSWDPVFGTGGVLALEASGTITNNSIIYADSTGFKGGALLNNTSNCSNTFPSSAFYYPSTNDFFGRNGAKKGEGIAEYISGKEFGKGKQANGGGGGNNSNHGGGGGGNAGSGGIGGTQSNGTCSSTHSGIGGTFLSAMGYSGLNFRVFLGGGGGAGHENNSVGTPGGAGGGIIYLKSSGIVSAGKKITANGGVPYNPDNLPFPYKADSDGGGGGGGGGVIILQTNSITGSIVVEAKGGSGSDTEFAGTGFCAGPGGGGGGGAVWFSAASIPGNAFVDVTGGSSGFVETTCVMSPNGSVAGSVGVVKTAFAFPALKDSSPVCKTILSNFFQVELAATAGINKILLTVTVNISFNISNIILQRSFNGGSFTNISSSGVIGATNNFQDDHQTRNSFYRVLVVNLDGRRVYSNIVSIRGKDADPEINIFPMPVNDELQFTVSTKKVGRYAYQVVDVAGRTLNEGVVDVVSGNNRFSLSVNSLTAGLYVLHLSCSSICYPFFKK